MTDDACDGIKRGRGRPRGTTEARWKVRAAILQARAQARLQERLPTNAEIIAMLEARGDFKPGHIESATRIIRHELAALERHEPPHPTNPFAGFFDLPMAREEDFETRDARAERVRAAAARRSRSAAEKARR